MPEIGAVVGKNLYDRTAGEGLASHFEASFNLKTAVESQKDAYSLGAHSVQ